VHSKLKAPGVPHLQVRQTSVRGLVLTFSLVAIAFWFMLAFGSIQVLRLQGSFEWFEWAPFLVVAVIFVVAVVARGPAIGWSPWLVVFATVSFVSAIEAVFAIAYLVMSIRSPDAFSEHLSRASAAYFTIGTATTTGFGDIHPCTDSARLFVTGQMVASFLVVALGIGTAFQHSLALKSPSSEDPPGGNSGLALMSPQTAYELPPWARMLTGAVLVASGVVSAIDSRQR
jgi:hypothetical protein